MATPADCETGSCPPVSHADTQAGMSDDKVAAPETNGSANAAEDPLDWSTFAAPLPALAFRGRLAPSIVIEYCNRCRWQHRATWIQTELFLTFEDKAQDGAGSTGGKYATSTGLKSITLIPCNAPETGGRFRVWLYRDCRADEHAQQGSKKVNGAVDSNAPSARDTKPHGTHIDNDAAVTLLWDRKIRGGFPELKELKQIVRDQIAPSTSLGHSDKKATKAS